MAVVYFIHVHEEQQMLQLFLDTIINLGRLTVLSHTFHEHDWCGFRHREIKLAYPSRPLSQFSPQACLLQVILYNTTAFKSVCKADCRRGSAIPAVAVQVSANPQRCLYRPMALPATFLASLRRAMHYSNSMRPDQP